MPRILRALFVAYVAATLVHIGWTVAHEPFSFDAWNIAVDTDAKPFSVGRFFDYWWFEYTHSNPRFGQAFTYLAYKLEDFAVIATPLAYLVMSLAITVLGLGRWPWRRGRDLACWAIVIGFSWFALPELGKTLFCRAYCANYIYGAAIQLSFVAVLRLVPSGRAGPIPSAGYALLGVFAGLCNEHTGPTLCLAVVGYALWTQLRTKRLPLLAWCGAAGAVIGFALIFFAPGQDERYDNLSQKLGLVGQLLQRGIGDNFSILRDYVIGAAPLLLIIVVVLAIRPGEPEPRRRALRFIGLALVAGTLMSATLFVSPKLGSRFYLVSAAVLLAGLIALIDAVELSARQLVPLVVLAVTASVYAGARTIPLFFHVGHQSELRMAALASSQRNEVFVADAFEQVEESWWFIGDDFRDYHKREMVVKYFDLGNLVFRAFDPLAALGASNVRILPRYELDPPGSLDAFGGFMMWPPRGFKIDVLHHETQIAIDDTRRRIAPVKLRTLELEVVFDDARPPLPAPRLLAGRFWPEHEHPDELYTADFKRRGRGATRDMILSKNLAGTDFEMYVVRVGETPRRIGSAKGGPLEYTPWRAGVYWILACHPTECFVVAATHQKA